MTPFQSLAATLTLLAASNVFMTFAWYAHLKHVQSWPWWLAAFASWGIALFEYLLQVPANRIGFASGLSLAQLKIIQEVVTLAVFAIFAVVYLGDPITWRYGGAFICLLGALGFMFVGR